MLRMLEVTTLLESVAWFLSVMMMTTCPRYMHLKQLHRGKRCYLQQMGSSYAASKLGKTPTSGRGRGRGKASGNLKQMTLDGSLGFHGSNRSASLAASASVRSIADEENVDSASSDEIEQLNVNDVKDSSVCSAFSSC
ncbi:meiotic recombination [Dionaea muscipula]